MTVTVKNGTITILPEFRLPGKGQIGKGNIGVHSRKEKRYICHLCRKTFTYRQNTLFYRLRTDPQIILLVIALLSYGCPVQAVVHAFHLDERSVWNWWEKAGQHCQAFHEHLLAHQQLELGQIQADEIKVKVQGKRSLWMALGMMVSTRLWLGGAVQAQRGEELIGSLARQIRQVALCRPLLVAVDGWNAYIGCFRKAFRSALPRRGAAGRAFLIPWPDIAIVQVIKIHTAELWQIERRIVQGAQAQIDQLIQSSQGAGTINTAYIERLNATFRQRLACLGRRTRHLARQSETLMAGMYVLGCVYNFCDFHQSLRLRLEELMWHKTPLPRWQPKLKPGRPSNETKQLMQRWAQ